MKYYVWARAKDGKEYQTALVPFDTYAEAERTMAMMSADFPDLPLFISTNPDGVAEAFLASIMGDVTQH